MNKYIKTTLFTIASLFLILITGCKDMNNSATTQEGKARIYFGIEQTAPESETILESARAGGISDTQKISGGQLDLNEMDYIALYHGDMGTSMIQMDCKVFQTQGSSTAYKQFTQTSMELNYGHYHFILEVFKGSNRYLVAEISDCEVTKNTTKIIFQTTSTYTDNTSQKSLKLYFTDNTNTVSKIKVSLYSSMSDTATGLIDTADLTLSDVEGFATQVFAYEKTGITNERCFLVYEIFNSSISLNKIGPLVVELTKPTTQATIDINSGEINALPDYVGTFGVYDPKIKIEVVEQSDKFYLNKGSIKVTGNNLTTGTLNGTLSAKLYYNGQEVAPPDPNTGAGLFSFIQDANESDYYNFSLLQNKPLLAGGLYQLVILAKEKVTHESDSTYYYAYKTIDFEVVAKLYYEFNLGSTDYNNNGGWTTLQNNITTILSASRYDVELKIYGNAYNTEYNYTGNWWRALRDSLKNSGSCKVDLDMREVGGLIGITNFANDDEYYMLRSIKLPVETYSITSNAFFGQAALQNIYIYCSTPSESMQTAYPGIELDIEEQAFAGLRALQKIEIEKVTPDAPCRYQTYADGKLLVKNTADGAMVLAATPDLKTFDLSTCDNTVIAIGGSAFSGSNIQTLTGTSNLETIGASAFINTASLTSIDLGKVTVVPNSAFCGSGVQTVTANKVTKIEAWGFKNTSSLTTIAMPEVTEIEYDAFYQSGLETITGDPKLEIIGSEAFRETNLTAIPDLSQVSVIDDRAFYQCKNLQSITIDDDIINYLVFAWDSASQEADFAFKGCAVQNMEITKTFEPTYDKDSRNYTNDWDKKRSVINSFKIQNELTFDEEVTLPDLYQSGNYVELVYDQFFSNSKGDRDNVGLKSVIFKKKAIIGQAQFSKFSWLESIKFLDEEGKNASEIGKQAFCVDFDRTSFSNATTEFYGTRSADNIILTGVKKIGFNVIDVINATDDTNKGGTLTIPQSVIAINAGAFKNIKTIDKYPDYYNAVTPEFTSASTDKWIKVSTVNINNGHTAEPVINGWLQSKPTTLPAADAGSAGSTDPQEDPRAKIELQTTVNEELVDIVPQFSDFMKGGGAYDQEIWYYRYTNYTGN